MESSLVFLQTILSSWTYVRTTSVFILFLAESSFLVTQPGFENSVFCMIEFLEIKSSIEAMKAGRKKLSFQIIKLSA